MFVLGFSYSATKLFENSLKNTDKTKESICNVNEKITSNTNVRTKSLNSLVHSLSETGLQSIDLILE